MNKVRRVFWIFVHDRAEWLWHFAWRQYCKASPPAPVTTSIRLWACSTDRDAVHIESKWYYVGDAAVTTRG